MIKKLNVKFLILFALILILSSCKMNISNDKSATTELCKHAWGYKPTLIGEELNGAQPGASVYYFKKDGTFKYSVIGDEGRGTWTFGSKVVNDDISHYREVILVFNRMNSSRFYLGVKSGKG